MHGNAEAVNQPQAQQQQVNDNVVIVVKCLTRQFL